MRPHKWIVCSFLKWFSFWLQRGILDPKFWNIWFTFTAKGSWCLSVLAKRQSSLWVQSFLFFILHFWKFLYIIAQGCAELRNLTEVMIAGICKIVASQKIENVIFFNECLLPFSFCFQEGHTSLAICQNYLCWGINLTAVGTLEWKQNFHSLYAAMYPTQKVANNDIATL